MILAIGKTIDWQEPIFLANSLAQLLAALILLIVALLPEGEQSDN